MHPDMRAVLIAGLLCGLASSLPLYEQQEQDDEVQQVGSSVTMVRVAPPDQLLAATGDHDQHHRHGGGGHDEVGYFRSKDTKGDHGYQAFDSFHKKDGDKYGFETHSAYGKVADVEGGGGGDKKGAGSEYHEEYHDGDEYSEGYAEGDDGKGNKYSERYSSSDDDEGGY